MIRFASHKTAILTLAAGFITVVFAGCTPQPAPAGGNLNNNQSNSLRGAVTSTQGNSTEGPLYLGEDWAEQGRAGSGAVGSKSDGSKSSNAAAANASSSPDAVWSLVLGTFSDRGHEDAARQMLTNLPLIAPQAAGAARLHTTPKGSLVVYGRYAGRDDANAKADQERLKAIQYNGRPVFNRIILTKLDLRLNQKTLHPHDLLSARRAHPNVDPLYTIDVAIWLSETSDLSNGDGKRSGTSKSRFTFDEAKRRGEQYAAQLRSQGHEAYFYHDSNNETSTVSVGLFDRRAIDSRSGLWSVDVVGVMRKFPARLVNGEPLTPGGVPQTPRLALVPRM